MWPDSTGCFCSTIFHVCLESYFIEILEEVASLRSAGRSIRFYHEGCEVSNELFPHRQREAIQAEKILHFSIDLGQLLSFASDHPNLVRPFFYFKGSFAYLADSPITSPKPPNFETLQKFRNITKISRKIFESSSKTKLQRDWKSGDELWAASGFMHRLQRN